ncbi:MAG TPA: DUF1269 domain-containing protein [Aggregatilinea sp.]|jgi:uncharacterized membrane protein|uniref:DUF1269 domain-containing protein n=1 Tax=Aggregatilinea sp. TaxID=2806333 RepID=UPI002C569FA8|nr:DUF1269 domain-containing protein [Aggregatilinea sp.]HML23970.1 DUF1269 domain-containing protein [Aggregatilinea sp.]
MFKQLWFRKVNLVTVFDSRAALAATMDAMLARGMLDLLDIGHSALIVGSTTGKPVIVNNNVEAQEGRFSGAMLGAVIMGLGAVQGGALDFPRGWAVLGVVLALVAGAALGAGIGDGVARLTRFGFSTLLLEDVGQRLSADQVALVLQVRPMHAEALEEALAGPDAHIARHER